MSSQRILAPSKRIALVAHDYRKADLLDWAQGRRELLLRHDLYATGTTGKMLEEGLNCKITKFFSGPLGGDQQIGSLIAQGQLDMLIFFWDPMNAQPHDTDVKALLRLSVAWNILLACDRATADFLVSSPYMNESYITQLPDYTDYLTREIAEED